MGVEDKKLVSVIVERRPCETPWQDHEWVVCGVTGNIGDRRNWTFLHERDGIRRYLSPVCELMIYSTDAEAYQYNLQSPFPSVFTVLREADHQSDQQVPFDVHLVSVSAYEAQDYMDSSEERVDRITLDGELLAWVDDFVDAHHNPEEFRKRRRDRLRPEEYKFGQEPLHELRRRGGPTDGGSVK